MQTAVAFAHKDSGHAAVVVRTVVVVVAFGVDDGWLEGVITVEGDGNGEELVWPCTAAAHSSTAIDTCMLLIVQASGEGIDEIRQFPNNRIVAVECFGCFLPTYSSAQQRVHLERGTVSTQAMLS